jgi:amino acid transporter
VINYILLPVFVLFYVVYKFWHKTKIVKPHEMDIWTGRREDTKAHEPVAKKSVFHRIKNVVVG